MRRVLIWLLLHTLKGSSLQDDDLRFTDILVKSTPKIICADSF